jgi:cell division septum initiation protein DivIVA
LKKENSSLRRENWELKQRVMEFTSTHEAKIAVRKEELYKAIIQQKNAFESKYSRARKAISDIHKIVANASESPDTVCDMNNIYNIIINFYRNNKNGNTDN